MLNDNLKSDKTADEKCNKSADKSVNSETSENRNDITMVQKVPETSGKKYPKKDAISPAEEHAVVKRNEAEKKALRSVIVSYSVYFAVAAGICLWIIAAQGIFKMTNKRTIFGTFADGFFVPGILLSGFGILYRISAGGFFDGITYGLKRAFLSFIPGGRLKKEENYAAYKERKTKNRKKFKNWVPLIVGVVFILVAVFFLFLYESSNALK